MLILVHVTEVVLIFVLVVPVTRDRHRDLWWLSSGGAHRRRYRFDASPSNNVGVRLWLAVLLLDFVDLSFYVADHRSLLLVFGFRVFLTDAVDGDLLAIDGEQPDFRVFVRTHCPVVPGSV